jgi:pimeloyl-ACP methyl ester carboxylesterase
MRAKPELASSYIEAISAPHKEFIALPNAGHAALVTHRDEFLEILAGRVRRFALRSTP